VRELAFAPGPLDGVTLRDAHIHERFGVTVVAITRLDGSTLVNPPADTVLRAGDRLRAFGLPVQATRSVLREPLTPKTGIGFVIDVDRVFGMGS
jgi:Trk K+ transport system NAD-binding subunit